jgi:hypothetical protein
MFRAIAVLLLALSSFSFAQEAASAATPAGADPCANFSLPDNAKNHKERGPQLSDRDAEVLFQSVNQVLEFLEQDTGLKLKDKVKPELVSRDAAEAYVLRKMKEDEEQEHDVQRAQLVLKKFRLLPQNFCLQQFLPKLMREQVAGYYDTQDKRIHLLNWMDIDAQLPVMAHELTHALQDQTIDLDKWNKQAKEAAKAHDADESQVDMDEELTARDALLEGQATVTMMDYLLRNSNLNVLTAPAMVAEFEQGMDNPSESETPLMAGAPLVIRESLTFPYRDGMEFVRMLLLNGGKKRAFLQALHDPPRDSHEILSPAAYLKSERVAGMLMPKMADVLSDNYKKFDVGSFGQFDVKIFLQQFASEKQAERLSPEWHGGLYYAAVKKSVKPEQAGTADLALLYVSRWSAAEKAQEFAHLYLEAVKKRYPRAVALDATAFQTEEGKVRVSVAANYVLVAEGFDDAALPKLLKAFAPPGAEYAGRTNDLSFRFSGPVYAAIRQAH